MMPPALGGGRGPPSSSSTPTPSPAPSLATQTSQTSSKREEIVHECFRTLLESVLRARSAVPANAVRKSARRGTSSAWFNLTSERLDLSLGQLRELLVLELSWGEDLFETWTMQYVEHDALVFGAGEDSPEMARVRRMRVYFRLMVLVRSAISVACTLPGHSLAVRATNGEGVITPAISFHPHAAKTEASSPRERVFAFPTVETERGHFLLTVVYASDAFSLRGLMQLPPSSIGQAVAAGIGAGGGSGGSGGGTQVPGGAGIEILEDYIASVPNEPTSGVLWGSPNAMGGGTAGDATPSAQGYDEEEEFQRWRRWTAASFEERERELQAEDEVRFESSEMARRRRNEDQRQRRTLLRGEEDDEEEDDREEEEDEEDERGGGKSSGRRRGSSGGLHANRGTEFDAEEDDDDETGRPSAFGRVSSNPVAIPQPINASRLSPFAGGVSSGGLASGGAGSAGGSHGSSLKDAGLYASPSLASGGAGGFAGISGSVVRSAGRPGSLSGVFGASLSELVSTSAMGTPILSSLPFVVGSLGSSTSGESPSVLRARFLSSVGGLPRSPVFSSSLTRTDSMRSLMRGDSMRRHSSLHELDVVGGTSPITAAFGAGAGASGVGGGSGVAGGGLPPLQRSMNPLYGAALPWVLSPAEKLDPYGGGGDVVGSLLIGADEGAATAVPPPSASASVRGATPDEGVSRPTSGTGSFVVGSKDLVVGGGEGVSSTSRRFGVQSKEATTNMKRPDMGMELELPFATSDSEDDGVPGAVLERPEDASERRDNAIGNFVRRCRAAPEVYDSVECEDATSVRRELGKLVASFSAATGSSPSASPSLSALVQSSQVHMTGFALPGPSSNPTTSAVVSGGVGSSIAPVGGAVEPSTSFTGGSGDPSGVAGP